VTKKVLKEKRFLQFAIFAGVGGIIIGVIIILTRLMNFWQ